MTSLAQQNDTHTHTHTHTQAVVRERDQLKRELDGVNDTIQQVLLI